MARYIDADLLKDEYYELYHHGTMAVKSVLSVFVNLLDNQPTADVAEVKHGKIIETIKDGKMNRVFSCCNKDYTVLTKWIMPNFCPHCGAKMDGGKE